jgi:hypothetical protein
MPPLGPKPAAFWLAVRALRIEVGKTGIEPTLGNGALIEPSGKIFCRWRLVSSRGFYVSHREAGERSMHSGYALGV